MRKEIAGAIALFCLASCQPGEETGSPDAESSGDSADAADVADGPDTRPSSPQYPGPCWIGEGQTGNPVATFFYDEQNRLIGTVANGVVVSFDTTNKGWERSHFYYCDIDSGSYQDRLKAFRSCTKSEDPKKSVGYSFRDNRPYRGDSRPTIRGGAIQIDFTYDDDGLKEEDRHFKEPAPMTFVPSVEYTWSNRALELREQGDPKETYTTEGSAKNEGYQAICLLELEEPEDFPRGRCFALSQLGGAIASHSVDGEVTEFQYDSAGNLSEVRLPDGNRLSAIYSCWEDK